MFIECSIIFTGTDVVNMFEERRALNMAVLIYISTAIGH